MPEESAYAESDLAAMRPLARVINTHGTEAIFLTKLQWDLRGRVEFEVLVLNSRRITYWAEADIASFQNVLGYESMRRLNR
jgi:hypothetical protein